MLDRKLLENIDWWLVLSLLAIMVLGFVNLYSASTAASFSFQWKQLQWYGAGLVIFTAVLLFDYRVLATYWVQIYLGTVLLLVLVLFVGKTVSGSQRWLSLGFFNLQPSEITKLLIIIAISSYFHEHEKDAYNLRDIIKPTLLVMVPVGLIYIQPDLGTALLILMIYASMVLFARLTWKTFIGIVTFVIAMVPLAWKFMKPYQRRRVTTFLNPESDPFGSGWHVLQSKIAVGSGQIWGKGFMEGTQAQLNFLPEVHTDFAFSIWAEEWGFIGAIILIGIYFFFLVRCIRIAQEARDRFGAFLAFGITSMIFLQVVINVFMVLGLLPVVGIPLPLISYGGSSVITTLMGAGIILNIRMRRGMF